MVVACHSGRGRSGTLAAVIAGLLHEARTVGEAVDWIVRMRCGFWCGFVCLFVCGWGCLRFETHKGEQSLRWRAKNRTEGRASPPQTATFLFPNTYTLMVLLP